MAIVRWNPFRELEDMNGRLNRLFGQSGLARLPSDQLLGSADWSPAVDIAETQEEYLVKAELPDVKKENVKVSVEEGVLRIHGDRQQEKEEKGKTFHRIERSYGSFMRAFQLPSSVDETKVSAEFKDGMLSIRVPKAARPVPKAHEIKIG